MKKELALEGSGDLPIVQITRHSPVSPSAQVVGAYVLAFQRRYGTRPPISGKMLGRIKCLLKYLPSELLCELIQVYLLMSDNWFITRCHDFDTFESNLTRVKVAHASGGTHSAVRGNRGWEEIAAEKERLAIGGKRG